jgi:hypothetical protein
MIVKKTKYIVPLLILALIWTPFSVAKSSTTNESPLDGDNTLERSYRIVIQGDVTTAGVGLSGTGEGDIVINDLPSGAHVREAFLYWATIGSANTFTSPTLNGNSVDGSLIGRSANTCWDNLQNNFVYRANVTSLVDENTTTYRVAGLPGNPRTEGNNDTQGASLVVVYSDPGEPFRTIILNDGAVSLNFDQTEYTDTLDGFTPDDPVSEAKVTYLMGDGQSQFDNGDVTFNGTSIATNIFNGVDGDYWGTITIDVTGMEPSDPSTTTIHNNIPRDPSSPDCLLWAATLFSITSPIPSVHNELSQFTSFLLPGNVTSAGVGLRGQGNGTITMTGIPQNGFVYKAFLYWGTLGSSPTFTSPELNGQAVDGKLIGVSADTCWGADANFVYRADVTSLVQKDVNTYQITGLPSGDNPAIEEASQGASLVVVYVQPPDDNFRTIILHDGAVTLDFDINSFTDTFTGFQTSDPVIDSHITYIVGDGQSRWENGDVTFNGTSIAHNVFNGNDGNYWGTLTFDIAGLSPTSPSTTTIHNLQTGDQSSPDCLVWTATIFSVTPPQPNIEVQAYLPLINK